MPGEIAREVACGLDPSYYVERLGFACFPWQRAVLSSTAKRIVIDGARQSGKSTISSARPCHMAKYRPGSLSIIIAPTEDQAAEDMAKVKAFVARDPDYPPIKRYASDRVELHNGSRIIIVIATDKAARGYSAPDLIIIDEASRVLDVVYKSGVRPMLTDNKKAVLILISTPFGKRGFFYEAFVSGKLGRFAAPWERYLIRSPYTVDPVDSYVLHPYPGGEQALQAEWAERGVKAWFSPRHQDQDYEQEQLLAIGKQQYEQEMCCDFVEADDMVFGYDDINAAFGRPQAAPLFGATEDIIGTGQAPAPNWGADNAEVAGWR